MQNKFILVYIGTADLPCQCLRNSERKINFFNNSTTHVQPYKTNLFVYPPFTGRSNRKD